MKIQFNTGYAAFNDPDGEESPLYKSLEVVRILKRITQEVENGYTHSSILDINGNKIGSWEM